MKTQQANGILKKHNEWRRHDGDEYIPMVSPKELGVAIDTITKFVDDNLKEIKK